MEWAIIGKTSICLYATIVLRFRLRQTTCHTCNNSPVNNFLTPIAGNPSMPWWAALVRFTTRIGLPFCCSPHGTMGLFYAWDSIIQCHDGHAQINLLLNRASPWMDIDSNLPYEGKVVLKNKTAREAVVRIPLWADKNAVVCRLNNAKVDAQWQGRYLRVDNLKPQDTVTIEFPMVTRTETWTIPAGGEHYVVGDDRTWPAYTPGKTVLTMTFQGNTLIDCSPPLHPTLWMYKDRKDKYSASQAPTRKVIRYVSPMTLQW